MRLLKRWLWSLFLAISLAEWQAGSAVAMPSYWTTMQANFVGTQHSHECHPDQTHKPVFHSTAHANQCQQHSTFSAALPVILAITPIKPDAPPPATTLAHYAAAFTPSGTAPTSDLTALLLK